MGTTTETRITSTQAKDAIYKAHSMPSVSEVNGAILGNYNIVKKNILLASGETISTSFIPDISKDFRIQMALELKTTTASYTTSGITGAGGNARVLIGTVANGSGIYVRVGNVVISEARDKGVTIIDVAYNSKAKTVDILVDGYAYKKNTPVLLTQGTTPFGIGGNIRLDGSFTSSEISESNIYFCYIYDNIDSSVLSLNSLRDKVYNTVDMIAHRGLDLEYPENTMGAMEYAVNKGIKHLECDVQVSSDGELILMHDSTVDRTTNGTGEPKNLSLSSLLALDAGSYFSSGYQGERIPTFKEFCEFAKKNNCTIYPEIKAYRSQADLSLFSDIIVAYGLESKCVLTSFYHPDLDIIHSLNSSIKIGYLSSSVFDVTALIPNSYVIVLANAFISNPSFVDSIKEAGHKAIAYTSAHTYRGYSQLLNLGVDGIIVSRDYQ